MLCHDLRKEKKMKDKLKKYFTKMNWSYVENGPVLKLNVDGDTLSWGMFLKADEADSFCGFAVLPTRIPESRIELVSQLTNLVNSEIWYGNFELILSGAERGQLRFRTASFVPESLNEAAEEELIEKTLSLNMAAMNRYAPLFMKGIYGDSDDLSEFLSDNH